jgi:hypothetical protein
MKINLVGLERVSEALTVPEKQEVQQVNLESPSLAEAIITVVPAVQRITTNVANITTDVKDIVTIVKSIFQ